MPVRPRDVLEWVVPGAAVLFAIGLALTMGARLPDPVATGWPSGGEPVGPARRWMELSFGVFAVTISAAVGAIAPHAATVRLARSLVVLGHVGAIGWAGRLWRIVAGNLDAERWSQTAATVPVGGVLVAMITAGLVGWLVSRHHRHRGRPQDPGDGAGG